MITRSLKLVDLLDTPEVLDTSSTNIPASGSSTLTVVSALAKTTYKLYVQTGITSYIGVYTGASGQEVLATVVGVSGNEFEVSIHRGARISLRAMENSAISSGKILIQFYGLSTE